jgi:hypothetical protein
VTEDDWHLLCVCDVSLQARLAAGIDQQLLPRIQSAGNIRELIFNICAHEDKYTAGFFAMVVWVLWNNRNNKVWNDMADTGRSLGVKARHLWEEWAAVQQLQHIPVNSSQVQQVLRRQRPSQGWYKCNVDAAFHQEINKTSTSWCLRDYLGILVTCYYVILHQHGGFSEFCLLIRHISNLLLCNNLYIQIEYNVYI